MTRATTSTIVVVAAAAAVVINFARGGEGGAYKEAARVGIKGCARDQTCVSWCSRLPSLRLSDRKWGLALVVQRSGKAGAFFCRRGLNPRRKYRNNSVIQRT